MAAQAKTCMLGSKQKLYDLLTMKQNRIKKWILMIEILMILGFVLVTRDSATYFCDENPT